MQEFVDFVENRIEPMDTKQEPKKEEAKKGSFKRKNKESNDRSEGKWTARARYSSNSTGLTARTILRIVVC